MIMVENIKNFLNKNRKIIIIAALMLIIIVALVIFWAVSNGSNSDTDSKTVNKAAGSEEGKISADNNIFENSMAENNVNGDSNKSSSSSTASGQSTSGITSNGGTNKNTADNTTGNDVNNSAHVHKWIDHTAKRWVPKKVTVVDEPEKTQKVTVYKLYWWDSKKWTETKDSAVFDDWYKKKFEWMVEYRYPDNMPPELYIGEDENGNPQYTNDHSIITYYETVPAVTHEEDQGYYQTYVDYQYCECGARRQ
jgi:hypothetical protein